MIPAGRYHAPMTALGTHVAASPGEVEPLLRAEGDDPAVLAALDAIVKVASLKVSSGRAWDPLHRCLSNGTLFPDEGEAPLNLAVLGGKQVYGGEDRLIACVTPDEVKAVAAALGPITEAWLRERYDAIDPDEYDGEHGAEDFRLAWQGFTELRDFYARAAADGRAVVFAVDDTSEPSPEPDSV